MKTSYKFRIYPTDEQKAYFKKNFGGNRYIWNWALGILDEYWEQNKDKPKEERDKFPSPKYVIARSLPRMKKEEETSWLKELDSQSLIYTLWDLEDAFKDFFSGKCKHPKRKKRDYSGSFSISSKHVKFNWKENRVELPKTGLVEGVFHRKWECGKLQDRAVISKESFDRYYVSFTVDDGLGEPEKEKFTPETTVGVDMGIRDKTNAILSDGTRFDIYHIDKRLERRIKREQRKLKRKQWTTDENGRKKPSKNYLKQKDKVAKLIAHTREQREHNTNEISAKIVRDPNISTICVEDLNVNGMMKGKFAKNTANANMAELRRQIEYKCNRYGKNFMKVDRMFPSSQMCSCCGYKNKAIKDPSIHAWTCPKCGTRHDRDVNAAINLKNEAIKIFSVKKMKK